VKELIIPLFGNISAGTVQKLYNKSRSLPTPLVGVTLMRRRLFAESSCYAWHVTVCPSPHRQEGWERLSCLVGKLFAKALTLSMSRSA
jgi:hypothetical protein